MTMEFRASSIDDFSGGITDSILSAKPNQSAVLQNFLINPNKKLYSAWGSLIYNSLAPQVPDGNARINSIFPSLLSALLVSAGRKVWMPGASSYSEFTGPSGNSAFSVGTSAATGNFCDWNQHVLGVNSEYALPVKFYIDNTGVWRTRTAGLPSLATSPTIAGTPNFLFTVTAANATVGATYTASGITYTVLATIAGATTLSTSGASIPAASGTLTKATGAGDATITYSAVIASGSSYLYALLYQYNYNTATTLFSDFGPTTQVTLANVSAPNVSAVGLSAIPVLANGATGNYDTANVTVWIYRTIAGGSVFYKVGQVTNGTTTFSDTMSDTTLQLQTTLYTNSGVLDNTPPPASKYITTVNGFTYYGNISGFPNRVMQSNLNQPGSVPGAFLVDFTDTVMGLGNFNGNPIVFTANHVYQLNGAYTNLGQGQITYTDITRTVGCVSNQSIVSTRYGIFWAGNDGFYWTDSTNFQKVSDSFNMTYSQLVSTSTRAGRISGCYDSLYNRIYWAVTAGVSSQENDSFYTLDLRWGINLESSFTTRSNGSIFTPTCLAFYNNQIVRGDLHGYLFKHDPSYAQTDPTVNTAAAPSLWATSALTPLYVSAISDLGIPAQRKWAPKILLTMENLSNVSVQIQSINDASGAGVNLQEIRYRGNPLWGEPSVLWGQDPQPLWNIFPLIENMRNFPARSLRCSHKQLIVTQSFTDVYRSDDLYQATASFAFKTAVIATGTWPSDVVNYYISFANDGYVNNYLISNLSLDGTTITFFDPYNLCPNDLEKWVIRGYPKGENFGIVAITIYFAPISSQSFKTWRSEQDTNGGNS